MKFNVYDSVNEEGRQFIKHIAAEDGTEFMAVAFMFPGNRIKTLAECLDDGAYTVELNHPAVNSHDGLVSALELFVNSGCIDMICHALKKTKKDGLGITLKAFQVKAKAVLDAVKEA